MKFLGAVNVLLGVMAGFSAAIAFLLGAFTSGDRPLLFVLYGTVLCAVSVCGVAGGLRTVRSGTLDVWTPAFAVLLLVFAGLLIYGGDFAPVRHSMVIGYAVGLLASVAMLRPSPRPPVAPSSSPATGAVKLDGPGRSGRSAE